MAKILVADDNRVTSEMVCFRLSSAGYEIERAADGAEALRLAAECRPDLIILDVMMPELNGFEVLERLKEDPALEPIPVIMLTAKSQEQDVLMGLSAGADDYMLKPFNAKELLARIERLTTGRSHLLRIAVKTAGGQTFVGELVEMGRDRIATRFPGQGGPVLELGEQVVIGISAPKLPEAVELDAETLSRTEEEPHRIFYLRVDRREIERNELANSLFQLIGNRGAVRVQPSCEEPIAVELYAESGGEHFRVTGDLEDISAGGARVRLGVDADRLLSRVELIGFEFRLSLGSDLVRLAASIRHRALREGATSYGIRFEPDASSDFEVQQQKIVEYVVRRQQEGS